MSEPEIFEFDADQAKELLKLARKTDQPGEFLAVRSRDPLVRETLRGMLDILPRIIDARRRTLSEREIEDLVEFLIPEDPLATVRKSLELDNAVLRAKFLGEVPCLTSRKIHEVTGSKGRNLSMPASRWKRDGRVFAIPWRGKDLYPAFQLRDGHPLPIIKDILEALPQAMSPWQIAFWFTSENGWIGGDCPCDALGDEKALIAAARAAGEKVMG